MDREFIRASTVGLSWRYFRLLKYFKRGRVNLVTKGKLVGEGEETMKRTRNTLLRHSVACLWTNVKAGVDKRHTTSHHITPTFHPKSSAAQH